MGRRYLIVGVPLLLIFSVFTAITGNWTLFFYASPIFVLCLALALILVMTPPSEADDADDADDGVSQAIQLGTHLRR